MNLCLCVWPVQPKPVSAIHKRTFVVNTDFGIAAYLKFKFNPHLKYVDVLGAPHQKSIHPIEKILKVTPTTKLFLLRERKL